MVHRQGYTAFSCTFLRVPYMSWGTRATSIEKKVSRRIRVHERNMLVVMTGVHERIRSFSQIIPQFIPHVIQSKLGNKLGR